MQCMPGKGLIQMQADVFEKYFIPIQLCHHGMAVQYYDSTVQPVS